MTLSLRFYNDPGLTMPAGLLDAVQAADGAAAAVDQVVYLGAPIGGHKFQDAADPGGAQMVVSVVDAATGLQIPATTVRLALSAAALGSATPGAALDVGLTILSGAGHAVPVHVRFDAAAIAAGVYDNISLATSLVAEGAV